MQLYNDDVAGNRKRLDKLSAGVEPVATFLFNVVFVFSVTVFQRCFSLCFRFSLAGDLFLRFCGGGTTGSVFLRFCGRGAGGRFMDSSGSGFSTFCCFFFFLV